MKNYTLAALGGLVVMTLASCAGPQADSGGGMDHGGGGGSGGASTGISGQLEDASRQAVMPDGEYSDRAFIDEMVPHHEGAVEMAEVALENAEHREIEALARDIISSQRAEIETLGAIRERRFGSSGGGMDMEGMEGMRGMAMTDPDELAGSEPFDRAFIDAMVPHHQSAVVMARVAREETEDEEIRALAADIVLAQEREIEQMNRWRDEWFPEG